MLADLAEDDAHLADLFDLDNATSERRRGERGLLPGIGMDELVFGIPNFRMINAAFTYARPEGSRFNGPERGAWYCSLEIETALSEVSFHKTVEYREIGRFDDSVAYEALFADFTGEFHDLRRRSRNPTGCLALTPLLSRFRTVATAQRFEIERRIQNQILLQNCQQYTRKRLRRDARFARCLDPRSYVASQGLAERLLGAGSVGVIYHSVRRKTGTNLACFRPAVVGNVRRGDTWRFTWAGTETPRIEAGKSAAKRGGKPQRG